MRDELRPQWPLVDLAKSQHGVVSHSQVEALGYSTTAIGRAIRAGRLHVMHRGVYAVGHPVVSRQGRCLAAVLAGGTGAMLSHAAAGWLWGLLRKWPGELDVTTPVRGHRKAEIVAHHSTILDTRDRAMAEGVPVTAVPRTLLDLAALRRPWLLDEAVERAERLHLLDIGEVDELLDRSGKHRGRAKLRSALEIYRPAVVSRAKSERLFLALVKRAGLPTPAINTFVAGHEGVDGRP